MPPEHGATPPSQSRSGGTASIPANLFASDPHTNALVERGVRLAPLIVQWHYQVLAARPFAKWLKTKEIILADARLSINENTDGIHYFGTYITPAGDAVADRADGPPPLVACQTIWGFSNEAAMAHMFELCRGNVERVSIVEYDLRDFVAGLKAQIHNAGGSFEQTVMIAPAAS